MRTFLFKIPSKILPAFGMTMDARTWSSQEYRFGFNGKEKDDEVNVDGGTIVFEARIYDSRICRFLSTDPLEVEYAWQSTYVFAHNNPIALIDFLGMGDPPKTGDIRANSNGGQDVYDAGVNGGKGRWIQGLREVVIQGSRPDLVPDPSICQISVSIEPKALPQIATPGKTTWEKVEDGLNSHLMTVISPQLQCAAKAVNSLAQEGYVAGQFFTKPHDQIYDHRNQQVFANEARKRAAFFSFQLGATVITSGAYSTVSTVTSEGNYAFRSLTAADLESYSAGRGIFAKAPKGTWAVEEHCIRGSSPKSFINDPWIATTSDLNVATEFSSGNGIIRVNLTKVPSGSIQQGWMNLSRTSGGYHYSFWQQEVSIFNNIPQNAITLLKF